MNPSNLLIDIAAFPGGVTGILVSAGVLAVLAVAALIAFKIFARTVKMALKLFFVGIILLSILVGAATIYFFSGSEEPANKPANTKRMR